MLLSTAINRLIAKHGGLRPAARAIQLDVAYLSRLRSNEKSNPSDEICKKLGVRKNVTITYTPIKPRK